MAWSLAAICQWRSGPSMNPLGRLTLVAEMALRTIAVLMPWRLSAVGLRSTRTAGSELPPIVTCPTPSTCEIVCASTVEAASYIWPRLSVAEVMLRIITGASEGLALR